MNKIRALCLVQFLIVVIFLIIKWNMRSSMHAIAVEDTSRIKCNGHAELCNKRFNQVAFITAHNAISNKASMVQDQDRSIEEQLADGIRSFKIPIHLEFRTFLGFYKYILPSYQELCTKKMKEISDKIEHEKPNPDESFKLYQQLIFYKVKLELVKTLSSEIFGKIEEGDEERIPYACHALPKRELYVENLGNVQSFLESAPEKIKQALAPIADNLNTIVKEAITELFGEKEAAGGIIPYMPCMFDTGKMPLRSFLDITRKFLDRNPHEVIFISLNSFVDNYDGVKQAFEDSGIIKYVHTQDKNQLWPTLGEMVKANKRLVVYIDRDNPPFPWMIGNFFFPWSVKYQFYSSSEITKTEFDPAVEFRYLYKPEKGELDNKFFGIAHQVTPGFAGSKEEASIVNARDVLRYRVKKYQEAAQHMVNFISVDFYQYPNKDVFDVQNEINGVGKYQNKPLWNGR